MELKMLATFMLLSGSSLLLISRGAESRSVSEKKVREEVSAVIPSPNDGDDLALEQAEDIVRRHTGGQQVAPASVPVYVSPILRSERSAPLSFDRQESSQAPSRYQLKPALSAGSPKDLKTSASYGHHHGYGGHHHHGHHGYDHSGWLDMGAWTGGKGSFGWYADYPVGSKHHGYGRK